MSGEEVVSNVCHVHTFGKEILEDRKRRDHDSHSDNYQSYQEVSGATEYRRPRCRLENEIGLEKCWQTLGEKCQRNREASRVWNATKGGTSSLEYILECRDAGGAFDASEKRVK
jgi:hypothetical protein